MLLAWVSSNCSLAFSAFIVMASSSGDTSAFSFLWMHPGRGRLFSSYLMISLQHPSSTTCCGSRRVDDMLTRLADGHYVVRRFLPVHI